MVQEESEMIHCTHHGDVGKTIIVHCPKSTWIGRICTAIPKWAEYGIVLFKKWWISPSIHGFLLSLLQGLFLRWESVGGGATGFTTNGFATDASWWFQRFSFVVPSLLYIEWWSSQCSTILYCLNLECAEKKKQGLPKTLHGNEIHGLLPSFPWKIWPW